MFSGCAATVQGPVNVPVVISNTDAGKVWAGKTGMTLYTLRKDSVGKSTCYGGCAKKWPPLMAAKDAKPEDQFSLVKRKDGAMQWALNGMPLYFWIRDKKKGDVTGDGWKGKWDVARP